MKKNFDAALEEVLRYEGGFTNHPLDKGGPTNLGITLGNLKDFHDEYDYGDLDGDGDIDIQDIILMDTKEEAAPIYKKYYWDRMSLDSYPARIDFLMFDFGVNSGPRNAGKILQRALNRQADEVLLVDGAVGPKTLMYLDLANLDTLIADMLMERDRFYRQIVENNPSQAAFLKGWLNRLSNVAGEVREFA